MPSLNHKNSALSTASGRSNEILKAKQRKHINIWFHWKCPLSVAEVILKLIVSSPIFSIHRVRLWVKVLYTSFIFYRVAQFMRTWLQAGTDMQLNQTWPSVHQPEISFRVLIGSSQLTPPAMLINNVLRVKENKITIETITPICTNWRTWSSYIQHQLSAVCCSCAELRDNFMLPHAARWLLCVPGTA